MARIRTIKPEFPQSETIGRLSRDARLLFIQLWTIADDSGRLRGASRMLASLLYPYDDDAGGLIGGWLDELERKGCIRRYEVGGSHYIEIINWLKHQKIDRPTPSRIPEFDETSRTIASPREPSSMDLGPVPSTSTKDHCGADARRPVKKDRRRATQYPEGFSPDFDKATSAGLSRAEAEIELVKFRNHAVERGRTCIDWQAAWHNWCLKAAEFKGRKPQAAKPATPAIPNEAYIVRYTKGGSWHPDFGPAPDQPGCRAPKELLEKYGFLKTEAA